MRTYHISKNLNANRADSQCIRTLWLILLLSLSTLSTLPLQGQNVTHIYTSFDGGWSSGVDNLNSTPTNTDSFLLGFTVDDVTYSTGWDDELLETLHGSDFLPAVYNALPGGNLGSKQTGTYVGIPYLWEGVPQLGGGANTGYQTLPHTQLNYYLTEGKQGLNLGTAVFNISANQHASYPIETINPDELTDPTAPAIVVTQMGDPSTRADIFQFVDEDGNVVGNAVSVILAGIDPVGEQVWAFFNANTFSYASTQPGSNPPAENTRDTRLRTFSLSDFGLNESNYGDVTRFIHQPSGDSDIAFIASYSSAFSFVEADLELNKSVNAAEPVTPGQEVTFELTVHNHGPADATEVYAEDELPSGYTFVGSTATAGSYDVTSGLWEIGNLSNGSTATLEIVARVLETGTYLNSAMADAFESDPDITNNTSSASIELADRSIAIVKTGSYKDTNEDETVNTGDHIVYEFTITNTGQVPLESVSVTDAKLGINNRLVTPSTLPVGSTGTLMVEYPLTDADIEAGLVENSATGQGTDPQNNVITDTSGTEIDNNDPTVVLLLVASDDEYTANGETGNPNVGNILNNDTVGSDEISADDVTIAIITPATPVNGSPVPLINTESGTVSVPQATPPGTYTIIYEICSGESLPADNCDRAEVIVIVSGEVSIDLTIDACWRLLSSPQEGQTYAGLLDGLWTQGGPGASHPEGNPNIFTWNTNHTGNTNEGWQPVTNLNTVIPAGSGFLISVFTDDEYGTPGSWPKTLTVTGPEHPSTVEPTPLNQTEYGWTLLGNPFQSPISFSQFAEAAEGLTGVAYTYDRNIPGWRSTTNDEYGDIKDGIISPFQGFFVQNNDQDAPSVNFSHSMKTTGGQFYGKQANHKSDYLRLEVEGEQVSSSLWIRFTENGSRELLVRDALKLDPMAEKHLILAAHKTGGTLVDIGHYPFPRSEEALTIPLQISATHSGTYTIRATDLNLPAGTGLYFQDRLSGKSIPLNSSFEYTFTVSGKQVTKNNPANLRSAMIPCAAEPARAKASGEEYRFVITSALSDDLQESGELPTQTTLEQNFPNPFNPSTIIQYNLAEAGEVQLEVFDTLGRRVATLLQGTVSAGAHTVTFDASGLNSGIYFYRLSAGNQILSRQMMLVK